MNCLLPLIFIVILAILFAAIQTKGQTRLLVLVTTLALVLTLCAWQLRCQQRENFSACGCGPQSLPHYNHGRNMTREGFYAAPVGWKMGEFDNVDVTNHKGCLARPNGSCDWDLTNGRGFDGINITQNARKPDYPILKEDRVAYHSPVGDAYALNPSPEYTKDYPTVDGKTGSPKSMFMFAYNRSSPACCPSTFSSSRGCVCMSEAQRRYINSRGGGRTHATNPEM
jgi:hypothetical protein